MKSLLSSIFYYGFPVTLLATIDKDKSADVTPISYDSILGTGAVITPVKLNKACHNVMEIPEVVFNLPSARVWEKVEAIAPYTAQNPIPPQRVGEYAYANDKFAIDGFTRLPSEEVRVPRIAECPVQTEAVVKQVNGRDVHALIGLEFVQVHTENHLVTEENEVNPLAWEPLIYNFRHYCGLGKRKELSFTIK